MAGETSNLRWGDDEWVKVTPRHFSRVIQTPTRFVPHTIDIMLPRKDTWMFYIDRIYLATFNTWDEAARAAPMLYQLHKDTI